MTTLQYMYNVFFNTKALEPIIGPMKEDWPKYGGTVHSANLDDEVEVTYDYSATSKKLYSHIHVNGEYWITITLHSVYPHVLEYAKGRVKSVYGHSEGVAGLYAIMCERYHIESNVTFTGEVCYV